MLENLSLLETWAVVIGLVCTTCIVISSMGLLVYNVWKLAFFWRYAAVANRMTEVLSETITRNRQTDPKMAAIAATLLACLNPDQLSREFRQELKNALDNSEADLPPEVGIDFPVFKQEQVGGTQTQR